MFEANSGISVIVETQQIKENNMLFIVRFNTILKFKIIMLFFEVDQTPRLFLMLNIDYFGFINLYELCENLKSPTVHRFKPSERNLNLLVFLLNGSNDWWGKF